MEIWFDREFESPTSEVVEKATNERRLSKNDWDILIRFLSLQDVRTPAQMFEHLKHAEQELFETLQEVLNDLNKG